MTIDPPWTKTPPNGLQSLSEPLSPTACGPTTPKAVIPSERLLEALSDEFAASLGAKARWGSDEAFSAFQRACTRALARSVTLEVSCDRP